MNLTSYHEWHDAYVHDFDRTAREIERKSQLLRGYQEPDRASLTDRIHFLFTGRPAHQAFEGPREMRPDPQR